MTHRSFDSNILIDALNGYRPAYDEIEQVDVPCISRITWIEVLSKERGATIAKIAMFLDGFLIDEVEPGIATRAASLRRQTPRLKLADAIILASAQVNARTLVTRNTKDFPPTLPGIRVPYIL